MTHHVTVLLHETVDGLDIKAGDVVVDGTFGGGGHSALIAEKFGDSITLVCIDQDKDALEQNKEKVAKFCKNAHFVESNARNIAEVLKGLGLAQANRILLDLGLSSDQFEISGRGFSFRKDEPLLMTFANDPSKHIFTAYDIVNEWGQESISDIIYGYSEEHFSRHIAQAIVEAREVAPIKTTFDLVKVIESAVPAWYRKGRIHPATKTFQALRIAVNDELGALKEVLETGFELLAPEGRMALISFHSLEDRILKTFFKAKADEGKAVLINKKVIVPGREEEKVNPRSRSAKLRIIQKI